MTAMNWLFSALDWHNRKYNLNESTKEVEEEHIGTFTQFPLKLAWGDHHPQKSGPDV